MHNVSCLSFSTAEASGLILGGVAFGWLLIAEGLMCLLSSYSLVNTVVADIREDERGRCWRSASGAVQVCVVWILPRSLTFDNIKK